MTFEQWWWEFISEHPEWQYADSDALRKAAFNAGAASRDVELVAALEECLSSGKSKGPEPHGISLKAIDKAEKALAKVRKP